MDVRVLSQGGQSNYDTTSQSYGIGVSTQKAVINSNGELSFEQNKDNSLQNKEVDKKELEHAVNKLNKFLEDESTHAEYEMHDKLKNIMIKIVDDNTGKVVMEIPPKKILDMVAKMCEMVGILLDKKA